MHGHALAAVPPHVARDRVREATAVPARCGALNSIRHTKPAQFLAMTSGPPLLFPMVTPHLSSMNSDGALLAYWVERPVPRNAISSSAQTELVFVQPVNEPPFAIVPRSDGFNPLCEGLNGASLSC